MGFPKEIYDRAAAVLADRRQRAREQSQRHRQEIYRLLPQIEQIDSQLRQVGMKTIQAVAGAPDNLEQIIERLKTQSLALQKQRDDLLEAAGLLEIYRDDGYTCKKCQDTGYVGAQKCECFQKLLRQAAFDALGAAHPQDCRFPTSRWTITASSRCPTGWCRGKRWRWSKTTAPPMRGTF